MSSSLLVSLARPLLTSAFRGCSKLPLRWDFKWPSMDEVRAEAAEWTLLRTLRRSSTPAACPRPPKSSAMPRRLGARAGRPSRQDCGPGFLTSESGECTPLLCEVGLGAGCGTCRAQEFRTAANQCAGCNPGFWLNTAPCREVEGMGRCLRRPLPARPSAARRARGRRVPPASLRTEGRGREL